MPALTPCPSRHNHAWRTAEAAGLPHDLTPVYGNPVHCLGCHGRAYHQLCELPELLAAVWLEATHGTRAPADVTTMRPSGIAPWPGQASRLMTDRIVGGLVELEDDIREQRRLRHRPGRGTEGATATEAVRFLITHLDWALTQHPAANEAHDRDSANPGSQIHHWHRAAVRFTRRDSLRVQMPAPCAKCDLRSLVQDDGDDYISCSNTECGALFTRGEYDDHVGRLTSGSKIRAVA